MILTTSTLLVLVALVINCH